MTFEEALNKKRTLQSPYLYADKDGSLPKQYKVCIAPNDALERENYLEGYRNFAYSGLGQVPEDFAKSYCGNNDYIVLGIRVEGQFIIVDSLSF